TTPLALASVPIDSRVARFVTPSSASLATSAGMSRISCTSTSIVHETATCASPTKATCSTTTPEDAPVALRSVSAEISLSVHLSHEAARSESANTSAVRSQSAP
ncbi:hypothetical protein BE221DRAFT_77249, partial [Ostreococcus tauri]